MDHRRRLLLAVVGVVLLFVVVQLGALALVEPYDATDRQFVEDPSDPGNVVAFFLVILVATAAMLAAIRYDLERVIQAMVLFACAYVTWLIVDTLLAAIGFTGVGGAASVLLSAIPYVAGAAVVLALWVHPEWYVVDAAGALLGAGMAGLFGIAITPQLTILFLAALAVYDAVSVYGTEHMLTLAEGVADLNVPVLLVVPTVPGFSLLEADGPVATDGSDADGADGSAAGPAAETESGAAGAGAGEDAGSASTSASGADAGPGGAGVTGSVDDTDATDSVDDGADPDGADDDRRDALYIGLGDAVMPSILVASAAAPHPGVAPSLDLPVIAATAPSIGAAIGTILGLLVLLWLVLRGRAHAGLPLLNGGAIAGYLLGAVAAGVSVAEALGVPI